MAHPWQLWPGTLAPARLSSARSVSEAQAILHRARIFAGYGGEARNRYVPARHYFFRSGSPSGHCGFPANRPGLYRSAGSLRVRCRMHVRRCALAALASIPGERSSLR
jgi:hypothetical protein